MIIPAGVMKIIGFKSNANSETVPLPTEGFNIVKVQLDNGQIIEINIFSNDKIYSNSLKDFLISKTNSVIKESEINLGSLDIITDEHERFKHLIDAKIIDISNEKPGLTNKKYEQLAAAAVAQDIIFNKRYIKQRSIIKLPVAIGTSQDGGNYYTSRSIQVEANDKGEKSFGRGGIYYFAQTENAIPIEITPIKNREGIFVGYFKITTGKLINSEQINFLIDHAIRTVTKLLSQNKKPFLLQLIKNDVAQQIPTNLYNLFKNLNDIDKINRESSILLANEVYENYKVCLNDIKDLMIANPSYYKFFKASLPLVVTEDKLKGFISKVDAQAGKSSLQKMAVAITSLNFSKENPNIKQAVTKSIDDFIAKMSSGEVNFKLLSNFNLAAPNIFGESDTWGYPVDNIASAKFTLSYNDTFALIQQAYSLVDQINNQTKSF